MSERRGCANQAFNDIASTDTAPPAPNATVAASTSDPISPSPGTRSTVRSVRRNSGSWRSQAINDSVAAYRSPSKTVSTTTVSAAPPDWIIRPAYALTGPRYVDPGRRAAWHAPASHLVSQPRSPVFHSAGSGSGTAPSDGRPRGAASRLDSALLVIGSRTIGGGARSASRGAVRTANRGRPSMTIWYSATSAAMHQISCGSVTSPNTRPVKASCICARSKTSSPTGSSGTRSIRG